VIIEKNPEALLQRARENSYTIYYLQ